MSLEHQVQHNATPTRAGRRAGGRELGRRRSGRLPEMDWQLLVCVVLLLGLWNMMRGTNPNTSQKLMRWRVGLQFFAILVIMAFFLLTR